MEGVFEEDQGMILGFCKILSKNSSRKSPTNRVVQPGLSNFVEKNYLILSRLCVNISTEKIRKKVK